MKTLATQVQTILTPRSRAVEKFLRGFLPTREPQEVYGVIREFVFRGGKRLRAALVMLGAEVVGGKPAMTIPVAAAIELFHAFTLIHDDIMDDSELRRGRPCAHITEGVPLAINAGDVLFLMAGQALDFLKVGTNEKLEARMMLSTHFQKVFEGQAMELTWVRNERFDVSEKNYFVMVEKKTAVLIGAALEVGGFLGGGSKKILQTLYQFGRLTGIAFQIRDDILNLVGEEEKYQKEIGGDITEGKRSLVVIHSLFHGSKRQQARLKKILLSHTRDKKLLCEAIGIVRATGSVAYAQRVVERYTEDAFVELQKLPRTKAREELEILANFLLTREV